MFLTLACVSYTFDTVGLSDKTQDLGLPTGSVRAVVALSLIVLFAIFSLFLFNGIQGTEREIAGRNDAEVAKIKDQDPTVLVVPTHDNLGCGG